MIKSTYETVDIPDEYIDVEPVFEVPSDIINLQLKQNSDSGNNKNYLDNISNNKNNVSKNNFENNIDNSIQNTVENDNGFNNRKYVNKKKYYDYYICPYIGFDGKPCCCEWTINTCTGCSKAWMNPINAFARALQCFPRIGETEQCAECSCCLCPCGMCGDCCILLTYCSL
jgi:hypothetical protein